MDNTFTLNQSFQDVKLAVMGMDLIYKSCDGLESFQQWIYMGKNPLFINSKARSGNLVYKRVTEESLLRVSKQALRDAGYDKDNVSHNVAVLVSGNRKLYEQPSPAEWVASSLGLSGPAMDLDEATTFIQVIKNVKAILKDQLVEAALLVAEDTSQSCAAVVFSLKDRVNVKSQFISAFIEATVEEGEFSDNETTSSYVKAFQFADITPADIGYLEFSGKGLKESDNDNLTGLLNAFRAPNYNLTCALSQMPGDPEVSNNVLSLLGLIKTILCLERWIIPAIPSTYIPQQLEVWQNTPFYTVGESRTWFLEKPAIRRYAANYLDELNAKSGFIVLSDARIQKKNPTVFTKKDGLNLFLITGNTLADILDKLDTLNDVIDTDNDLLEVETKWLTESQAHPERAFCLALLGHNAAELSREIDYAVKGIPTAVEKKAEWQTPMGSYFTPTPQGRIGKIAFVYPGAFNSYIGLGRDLFYQFPQLHKRIAKLTDDAGSTVCEKKLYPRSLTPLSKEQIQALEAKLMGDPISMLISGATFSVLYTHILREIFAIKPVMAFGYSLGENSMMFATGVWTTGDQARARLECSPVFNNRLAGPQNAIRENWGLPMKRVSSKEEPIWGNYLLMSSPEHVQELLESEERVYLTHINTPRQVVIAGDPQNSQRIITALNCTHLRMPFNHALHCEPVVSEYEQLYDLHHWEVQDNPGVALYSAANYEPIIFDSDLIANNIAQALCKCLDFPRLIHRVYEDGARIFIEVGAGSNCSKWIDDTLQGTAHLAVSVNRTGVDETTSLYRLLARLSSHRVKLDITPLLNQRSNYCEISSGLNITNYEKYPAISSQLVR